MPVFVAREYVAVGAVYGDRRGQVVADRNGAPLGTFAVDQERGAGGPAGQVAAMHARYVGPYAYVARNDGIRFVIVCSATRSRGDLGGVDDLPDDFAIALGRLLYLGGLVEMRLDRCLVPAGEEPPRRGLSGARLVDELRKVETPGSLLIDITNGYEDMHEFRNHLVHGAHNYANGSLWTWREPTSAKGTAAFSFRFDLVHLQDVAQSWKNLADAIQLELDQRERLTAAESEPQ
ncbi:hypothetical protein [Mycolicibacterium sp. XJ1904]